MVKRLLGGDLGKQTATIDTGNGGGRRMPSQSFKTKFSE
jgi:hypothetical protein